MEMTVENATLDLPLQHQPGMIEPLHILQYLAHRHTRINKTSVAALLVINGLLCRILFFQPVGQHIINCLLSGFDLYLLLIFSAFRHLYFYFPGHYYHPGLIGYRSIYIKRSTEHRGVKEAGMYDKGPDLVFFYLEKGLSLEVNIPGPVAELAWIIQDSPPFQPYLCAIGQLNGLPLFQRRHGVKH